jgi:hypothetical protein
MTAHTPATTATSGPVPSLGTPSSEGNTVDEDLGGDAACWLALVCPGCGAMADASPASVCPRCGMDRDQDADSSWVRKPWDTGHAAAATSRQ